MKKVDYIVFDFDWTIVDSVPVIKKTVSVILERNGIFSCNDKIVDAIWLKTELMFEKITNQPEMNNRLADQFDVLINWMQKDLKLFPNIKELLNQLYENWVKLSIFTSRWRLSLLPVLKKFWIDKFFWIMVCREDVKYHKPNPEWLNIILQTYKINDLSKIIMIWDSLSDFYSAKWAWIEFVRPEWIEKKILEDKIYSIKEIIDMSSLKKLN